MNTMKSFAGVGLVVLGIGAGCGLMLNYSDYETVAGTSTAGSGGSVHTGGSVPTGGGGTGGAVGGGGTGGAGTENCTDGIDNDGDGATDCADVKCQDLGYTCATAPSGGWDTWQGPIIGYPPPGGAGGGGAGGGSAASCVPGGYADSWPAYIIANVPPLDCACGCAAPTADCAGIGTNGRVTVTYQAFSDSGGNCATPCPNGPHTMSLQSSVCKDPTTGPAWPAPCNLSASIHSWTVESSTVQDDVPGICAATAASVVIPPVTWTEIVACAGERGAGCDTDSARHCAPPKPDANALICIYRPYQPGDTDADCPSPYTDGGLIHATNSGQLDDTRSCDASSCGCGTILGHCDGNVEVYANSDCTGYQGKFGVGSTVVTSCLKTDPEYWLYLPATFVPQDQGAICAPAGSPGSVGSVKAHDNPDFMLCCLPP